MPKTKRADLAFQCNELQMPIEVKGQWHDEVWDAAEGQLATQYLNHWRSEGRGVYCVLWFGKFPPKTKQRLKPHPDGAKPATAAEMRELLIARIPESRRRFIDVKVLDLAGKPTERRVKKVPSPDHTDHCVDTLARPA